MDIRIVNLKEKAGLIHELHSSRLVAHLNTYQINLCKRNGNSSGTTTMILMSCS
jgi:hypothetical protein